MRFITYIGIIVTFGTIGYILGGWVHRCAIAVRRGRCEWQGIPHTASTQAGIAEHANIYVQCEVPVRSVV